MSFDPAHFARASVVDTCAIWNMLSSQLFNQATIQAKLHFCITPVVLYECLQKNRSTVSAEQQELKARLRRERLTGRFPIQECSLEDLLLVSAKAPGKLGSGELSCIAVAYRIRCIAFMTDEKLARKFAQDALRLHVETTPRLYGFLHYHQHLGGSDHDEIIEEHEQYERRPLTQFFKQTFEDAMRCRLMKNATKSTGENPIIVNRQE